MRYKWQIKTQMSTTATTSKFSCSCLQTILYRSCYESAVPSLTFPMRPLHSMSTYFCPDSMKGTFTVWSIAFRGKVLELCCSLLPAIGFWQGGGPAMGPWYASLNAKHSLSWWLDLRHLVHGFTLRIWWFLADVNRLCVGCVSIVSWLGISLGTSIYTAASGAKKLSMVSCARNSFCSKFMIWSRFLGFLLSDLDQFFNCLWLGIRLKNFDLTQMDISKVYHICFTIWKFL